MRNTILCSVHIISRRALISHLPYACIPVERKQRKRGRIMRGMERVSGRGRRREGGREGTLEPTGGSIRLPACDLCYTGSLGYCRYLQLPACDLCYTGSLGYCRYLQLPACDLCYTGSLGYCRYLQLPACDLCYTGSLGYCCYLLF